MQRKNNERNVNKALLCNARTHPRHRRSQATPYGQLVQPNKRKKNLHCQELSLLLLSFYFHAPAGAALNDGTAHARIDKNNHPAESYASQALFPCAGRKQLRARPSTLTIIIPRSSRRRRRTRVLRGRWARETTSDVRS
jgi:hypothetical protein